jgi:hypothetical protein
MKAVAPALALFATIFALATPGTASADAFSVRADMNGDGVMDQVTLRSVDGNPYAQSLAVKVGNRTYVAQLPLDNMEAGVQQPRITDIDRDGRNEIFVLDSIGANTDWWSIWVLNGGLRQVTTPDGEAFHVVEGGGVYNVDNYSCVDAQLVREWASNYTPEPGDETFDGERITYDVHGATATEVSRYPVSGPRESFGSAPQTCA